MTFTLIDLVSIATILVTSVSSVVLWLAIREQEARLEQLRVARAVTAQFFDLADKLIADGDTPEPLKQMITHLAAIVTDNGIGQSAIEFLNKILAERREAVLARSNSEISIEIDHLRSGRVDLYDAFNEALRSAFAALVLTHAPDVPNVKIIIQSETMGASQTKLLGLAESVEEKVSGALRDRRSRWDRDQDDFLSGACA